MELTKSKIKLLEHAANIRTKSVMDRDDIGFSTRVLVQCNLPHSDPGNELPMWSRTNGNTCLSIQPRWYMKNGHPVCIGYPHGNIPRLILVYLCTQAVQTKSKHILLGKSLSKFMKSIDLETTGGQYGTINRFKEQMWRLLSCSISFTYDSTEMKAIRNTTIAHNVQLWWDTEKSNHKDKEEFDSYIELSDEFIQEIWSYPIPIDKEIICAIKQSPLALDLYAWLTYRVVYLEKPIRVSWMSLSGQVGSEYINLKEFARKAKEALSKIYIFWPELQIEEVKGGLILKPSKPSIPLKAFSPIICKHK